MLTAIITLNGHTRSDLELALEEVKRLINEGFIEGRSVNGTGSYSVNITGVEVAYYKLKRNNRILKNRFSYYGMMEDHWEPGDEILMFDDNDCCLESET